MSPKATDLNRPTMEVDIACAVGRDGSGGDRQIRGHAGRVINLELGTQTIHGAIAVRDDAAIARSI